MVVSPVNPSILNLVSANAALPESLTVSTKIQKSCLAAPFAKALATRPTFLYDVLASA